MAPRAQIFRQRAHLVHDIESMRAFMRYNDFEADPLAHMNPGAAVASRFDLDPNPSHRAAEGGYDSKVTLFCVLFFFAW